VRRASYVVVGGGVIGASVAWHLAARGARDVLVLDAAPGPEGGSTGAATGGFRAQYASAINVRLSLLARAKLLRFRDEVGADPGYTPSGYLWLAEDDDALRALDLARALQHAEGLHEAVAVGPDDIARLQPAIARGGLAGGAFCPSDGYILPRAIAAGYRAAGVRLGVRYVWGDAASGFDFHADGRIAAVRTRRGAIGCDAAVNAAGAWAGVVARLAGVDLPVAPERRQVAATVPTGAIPSSGPMTIYCRDGFHFRERDGRVLLLRPSPGNAANPFDASVNPSWLGEIATVRDARIPALRGIPVEAAASWAGLYEMSPDKHAIVGKATEVSNFYLVNGSSGHGVMHAPALGQLLAEIILDGHATVIDATPLAPDRFARGRALAASDVL
jgi:sarcosine oxidase, subunit beta